MSALWWFVIGALALSSVLLRNNLLFLLSLFLLLIGGVSTAWTRICLAAVTYRRQLGSHRLFFGEETELAVEIVNAKPLPLAWLRAEDELPAALELTATKVTASFRPGRTRLTNLLSLRWYERVTRRYRLRALRRGAWQLGPVELVSGDIFGFALRREVIPAMDLLLVYPKIVPLTALGLPAHRPLGDLQERRRVTDDPLRVLGAREYTAGDSFRHIHWKATARRQALQTKVFEPSASLPLAIFLNINTYDMLYEGLDHELQEYAVTAAASLARWAWENGHAVGLYINSTAQPGAQRIRIRPNRRPDQLLYILEGLAKVVDHGRWPIEAILQVEAPQLPYGAGVAVITATASDRLRQTLLQLHEREFGLTLIALGDKTRDVNLPGVRRYHIGGREEWHELAALALA
jgi:uncharacterized protein (DUF58 family)